MDSFILSLTDPTPQLPQIAWFITNPDTTLLVVEASWIVTATTMIIEMGMEAVTVIAFRVATAGIGETPLAAQVRSVQDVLLNMIAIDSPSQGASHYPF